MERFEISRKPEVLEKVLTTIFGEQKARTIDKLILVEIRNTFQLKEDSTLTFKEAIRLVKNSCISKLT